MKKSEGFFQKMFGGVGFGSSRVPLRSNIFHGAGGYRSIGQTGRTFDSGRQSPLLGNASPSNLLSVYYERIDELHGYQLIDICKLATNFFADYIINFLEDNGQQVVTILDGEGSKDEQKTERINDILTKDIKVFDYIRDHIKDSVFYGGYFSLLEKSRDELGHLKFRIEELYDPISVVIKKKRNAEGGTDETYLARGEDGKIYEIPSNEAIYIGSMNLRLVNDISDTWKEKNKKKVVPSFGKSSDGFNRDMVRRSESYSTGEPLFYSLIIKLKELIIKELLISLISLRDLSSVQIFLLQFDKSTPLETASDLCARTTKLANNTNELASFLTSQFDVVSFIENTLSQSAKFVPDYNSTIGNKNSMLPLDKLSDKLLDLMQNLDSCRNNVLSPLGIPATILDSTSGSKWAILQQSERANSKVSSFMSGIKDSVLNIVLTIYRLLYQDELDPTQVRLHLCEKTSVEYNNQINQSESISSLIQGLSGVLTTALQTLETSAPLIDTKAYLTYIQNLMKDIDPNTDSLISEKTIEAYSAVASEKLKSSLDQLGVDSSVVEQILNKDDEI